MANTTTLLAIMLAIACIGLLTICALTWYLEDRYHAALDRLSRQTDTVRFLLRNNLEMRSFIKKMNMTHAWNESQRPPRVDLEPDEVIIDDDGVPHPRTPDVIVLPPPSAGKGLAEA